MARIVREATFSDGSTQCQRFFEDDGEVMIIGIMDESGKELIAIRCPLHECIMDMQVFFKAIYPEEAK